MALEVRAYCAFMCEVRANGEHPMFDEFGIEHLFDLSISTAPQRRGRLAAAKIKLQHQERCYIPRHTVSRKAVCYARASQMASWKACITDCPQEL